MNKISYPLAIDSWGEEEKQAAKRVIDSGMYTMGEHVVEFERQFAQYFGVQYAVMVNSGSSANLLAIAALSYKKDNPLQPGDEVIVPMLSWPTTFYPIHQYGLKLVFVDIDVDTLNIDPEHLNKALSEKTKAIVVPHILGNPADIETIQKFCELHELYLIEDNCESMGATVNGKYTGTFGICGTFSTFFSHHMSTMEGGVITTNDEEIYHLLLSLRSHGWTRHLPSDNRLCKKSNDPFYESFRFILPGYNLRPMEISAAIGIEQLKKLDTFIQNRIDNARHFKNLLSKNTPYQMQEEKHGASSWFGFSLLIKDQAMKRDEVVHRLAQQNVVCRPIISGNFLRSEVVKHLNYRVASDQVQANYIHNHGFFIGNHHFSLQRELDDVVTLLDSNTIHS